MGMMRKNTPAAVVFPRGREHARPLQRTQDTRTLQNTPAAAPRARRARRQLSRGCRILHKIPQSNRASNLEQQQRDNVLSFAPDVSSSSLIFNPAIREWSFATESCKSERSSRTLEIHRTCRLRIFSKLPDFLKTSPSCFIFKITVFGCEAPFS